MTGKSSLQFIKHMAILFTVTFVMMLPLLSLFVDMEISMVPKNKEMLNYEWRLRNNQRIRKAEYFLNNIDDRHRHRSNINSRVDNSEVSVTIMIISSSRHQLGDGLCNLKYLTQTVSKFLEVLQTTTKDVQYKLCVCYMDDSTVYNPEIHRLSNFVSIHKTPYQLLPSSSESSETDDFEQKRLDYVFCAKNAIKEDTKFVLMTYDHMAPTINLSAVLRNILKSHNSVANRTGVPYVKLYHPEMLLSYFDGFERISELLSITVLLSLLLTVIYKNTFAYRKEITIITYIMFFIYVFLLSIFIGRKNISNIRTLSPHVYQTISAPPNHLEAVLYTKDKLSRFVDYLEGINSNQLLTMDIAIHNFSVDHFQSSPKMVQPNLMTNLFIDS